MAKRTNFSIPEVAREMAIEYGLNIKHASTVAKALLAIIQSRVLSGETFRAPGFGSFSLVVRKARYGRNPKTGEPVRIDETKKIKFRPSKGVIEIPEPYFPKAAVVRFANSKKVIK